MELSARPSRVLLVGSVALCSLGLLPLLELLYTLRQTPSTDKVRLLQTLTGLDVSSMLLSGLYSALGLALLALHVVSVSVPIVQRLSKLLGVSLLVLALANAVILTSVASHRGPDTPWRAEVYADHESLFEQQVNDVFCHAKGHQVCALGSVAEARQIFPLRNWPVDSDRAPGRKVATSCEGFKDSVQLWDYQSKMQLCRLCSNVTTEETQLQTGLGAAHTAEILAAVKDLSFEELQWCGEYLAERKLDHDVGHSPYWKHRREFQAVLQYDQPPCSLFLAVRVLQMLEMVSGVCGIALLRWMRALQTVKMLEKTSKVDVV